MRGQSARGAAGLVELSELWTRECSDSCAHLRLVIGQCSTSCYIVPVSREITQRELRNESGKIMRELDAGESFIVTRRGVPVGELSPLRRHRFVAAEAAVALFRSAPAVDYDRLRHDLDEVASQDMAPRG